MNGTKELYYYTSSDTMRYILTKGNIFATNLKYMNDGEEYVNGLTELREVLNEKYKDNAEISREIFEDAVNQQPNIYSISFSRERDLLSQWSMYAKESGVSIRMDFSDDTDKQKYEVPTNDPKIKKQLDNPGPHKVYYLTKHVMEKSEYDETCRQIILDMENKHTVVPLKMLEDIQDGINGIWQLLAPYVKRKEFFQEVEYRMTFALNSLETGVSGDDSSIKVDYRGENSVLKPYLDITRVKGWPVKEIMIGPGFNQKTVYDSVKHFFDNSKIMVPECSAEKVKENGLFFFKCLERDNRLSDAAKLEVEWEKEDIHDMENTEVVQLFNQFIDSKHKMLGAQEKSLENVYMSRGGIILSISEIPYIY